MPNTRAFDMYVAVKDPSQTTGTRVFDFGGTRTVGIKGFYKTILQWVKCLFTEPGSDISDANYGTALGSAIGSTVGSARDIRDMVYLSVSRATDILKTYQRSADIPDRERLASATLTSLQVATGQVEIYVTLTNQAGEQLLLTLPTGIRAPMSSP